MARILLIVPQYNNEPSFQPGGQVTAANGLRKQLLELGHDVDLVNVIPPNYTTSSKFSRVLSSFKRVFTVWSMLWKRRYECAILFTGSLNNLPERLLMTALFRIYDVKAALFFRNSSVLRVPAGSFLGHILARALTIPDFILVQGLVWKKLFLTWGLSEERISVIPNWLPVDISIAEKSKCLKNGDSVRFLFVGRIVANKGVFELVEAVSLLRNQLEFEVLLAGDGNALESLQHFINVRSITNIRLLGWQDRKRLAGVFHETHVLVNPTYHPEGFPNAVLEAMAYGLPIISTNVGAISESVRDGVNGYLITPRSPAAVASAMTHYLEDSLLISQHSAESLRIVKERHDRTKNCKKIIDLLCNKVHE